MQEKLEIMTYLQLHLWQTKQENMNINLSLLQKEVMDLMIKIQ